MKYKDIMSSEKILSDFIQFKNMFQEDIKTDNAYDRLSKIMLLIKYIKIEDKKSFDFLVEQKTMILEMINNIEYENDFQMEHNEFDENTKNLCSLISTFNKNNRHLNNTVRTINKLMHAMKKSKYMQSPNTFIRDYDRIISSSAIRRLQDKAQVYPLEKYDYVRTRLTHTHEVASIAEQIADIIGRNITGNNDAIRYKIKMISRCSSLIHDIGNPPFGHFGEDVIRHYFIDFFGRNALINKNITKKYDLSEVKISDSLPLNMKNDFIHFDGNAQGLRVITKLQQYKGEDLNISASIISAMIKYPYDSSGCKKKSKFGYFYSEKEIIEQLTILGTHIEGVKNPISLILEVSDDISNFISDFEDAVKKKIITYEKMTEFFEIAQSSMDNSEIEYFRDSFNKYYIEYINEAKRFEKTISRVISGLKKRLITESSNAFLELMGASRKIDSINIKVEDSEDNCEKDLISKTKFNQLVQLISEHLFVKEVYNNTLIIKSELSGATIIQYLLNIFIKAVLNLDLIVNSDNIVLVKKFDDDATNFKLNNKLFNLISNNFIEVFAIEINKREKTLADDIYFRLRLVVDYISGMTDSYAKDLYQELMGI